MPKTVTLPELGLGPAHTILLHLEEAYAPYDIFPVHMTGARGWRHLRRIWQNQHSPLKAHALNAINAILDVLEPVCPI